MEKDTGFADFMKAAWDRGYEEGLAGIEYTGRTHHGYQGWLKGQADRTPDVDKTPPPGNPPRR